jgi:predicted nucleic acid-binding protein
VIVVDASVIANVVADDEAAGHLARTRLEAASAVSAPDLVDVETVAVLRRRWLAGDLSDERFRAAVDDLLALPITRFPVGPLMVRAFELRANVTAYDACYVALAEALDCPLITADRRLANAPMTTCTTEVLEL